MVFALGRRGRGRSRGTISALPRADQGSMRRPAEPLAERDAARDGEARSSPRRHLCAQARSLASLGRKVGVEMAWMSSCRWLRLDGECHPPLKVLGDIDPETGTGHDGGAGLGQFFGQDICP